MNDKENFEDTQSPSSTKSATTLQPPTVHDKYIMKKVLGTGQFAEVRLAESRESPGSVYAIKIIDTKAFEGKEDSLENEMFILNRLKHPNIVELYEVYHEDSKIYLVMECETGGELFDRIEEKGSYTEKDASDLVKQVLSAVSYMHGQGIVHRDLKAENLLFHNTEENSKIMICDFGLSKMEVSGIMKTLCGTATYVAPEVLAQKQYGKSVDVWSIGVITYILLCGYPPFYAENDPELFEQILEGKLEFDSPYWDEISNDGKEFICQLMSVDADKRLSCEEALKHPWILSAKNENKINDSVFQKVQKSFRKSNWRQASNVISACRELKSLSLATGSKNDTKNTR